MSEIHLKYCNIHHQIIFKISRDQRNQNQSVEDQQLLDTLGKILSSVRIRPNIFRNSRTGITNFETLNRKNIKSTDPWDSRNELIEENYQNQDLILEHL